MITLRRSAPLRAVGSLLVTAAFLGACAAETTTASTAASTASPPVDEAPAETPTPTPSFTPDPPRTSESGMTLAVGPVEAALGHRASVITLTNDGARRIEIEGYPEVHLLNGAGEPVDVSVVHDSSYMAIDPGPATVSIAPGDRILSVVSWSATVTDADPDKISRGAYLVVAPTAGEAQQTFPLDTDLGTTGEISLTAWAAELVN